LYNEQSRMTVKLNEAERETLTLPAARVTTLGLRGVLVSAGYR
ncbi:hypothetical protein HKBW3S33_02484, partial [Candidatus Hakubella thermalkaliphila]